MSVAYLSPPERIAHQLFSEMGAAGFADRARRQPGSTGVGVPRAANAVAATTC